MSIKQLLRAVSGKLTDYRACEDMWHLCLEVGKEDHATEIRYLKKLSEAIEVLIVESDDFVQFYKLHEKVLKELAVDDFESYLLYMEWDREPKKKFYPPRRKTLKPVVDALQKLADGELEILCISLPPGAGKTTLALFFLTWLAGKYPNEQILTGSHSNSFIRGCYDECLRIMEEEGSEYRWKDVFPSEFVANTNAKDCRIDISKRKRFETLEFTTVGSGNAGLYRATRLLYCDDLVSGIEVALSKERLDKLWETYTTDLRQRKLGDHCAELHIATRWSVHDIIGRIALSYEGTERAEFITVPALNEKDESNFDYAYGVGFTTQFYREQREIMDDASWRALYMNEPIEREGLLYDEQKLRRYFDLPSQQPDAVVAVCDTKDRGADFACLPVAYVYGEDFYIDDIVCDNSAPDIVDERIIQCLLKNGVDKCRFESNAAGGRVAEKVQQALKDRGGKTNITTKFSTQNKETRILMAMPWIVEHCLFRSDVKKNTDYGRFLTMVCNYTLAGKNKHDDAPDSLAMLADFVQSMFLSKATIFQRPF